MADRAIDEHGARCDEAAGPSTAFDVIARRLHLMSLGAAGVGALIQQTLVAQREGDQEALAQAAMSTLRLTDASARLLGTRRRGLR